MSDEMGSWKAFDLNSSKIHECKKQNSSMPANSNGNGNDISVEVLLKKLSSIGIDIRLEVLRNAVNGDKK